MKLKEIAGKIHQHLKRFEADATINAAIKRGGGSLSLSPYYQAGSYATGKYVGVWYVSFHGTSYLTKQEAIRYLAWLDAGNVGRHYEALEAK